MYVQENQIVEHFEQFDCYVNEYAFETQSHYENPSP